MLKWSDWGRGWGANTQIRGNQRNLTRIKCSNGFWSRAKEKGWEGQKHRQKQTREKPYLPRFKAQYVKCPMFYADHTIQPNFVKKIYHGNLTRIKSSQTRSWGKSKTLKRLRIGRIVSEKTGEKRLKAQKVFGSALSSLGQVQLRDGAS